MMILPSMKKFRDFTFSENCQLWFSTRLVLILLIG